MLKSVDTGSAFQLSSRSREAYNGRNRSKKPEAIAYLRKEHNRLWLRSMFSAMTKVECVKSSKLT
jgi:hypothetical protein